MFYALHHRYRPGDYETWKYIAPIQKANWRFKSFEYGTWRGEIRTEFKPQPGDLVAHEHWCSSGFANTDLDQQLKLHGIHRVIIIGLITNTCVEATARFAAERGVIRQPVQVRPDAGALRFWRGLPDPRWYFLRTFETLSKKGSASKRVEHSHCFLEKLAGNEFVLLGRVGNDQVGEAADKWELAVRFDVVKADA